MKKITKSSTFYVCSTCNTDYQLESQALHCETRHMQIKCRHSNFGPLSEPSIELNNERPFLYLYKKCIDCGKIRSIEINHGDLEDKLPLDLLNKLWDEYYSR